MNVYYSPEKFGLTAVGEIEWSEPCYSFDTTAVWKAAGGTLYWASDSGCSCPTPFEGLGVTDLDRGTLADLTRHLAEQAEGNDYAQPQVFELISRLRAG